MEIHWIILSALLVLFVQARIYSRFGSRKLSYTRRFSVNRCFAGDDIEMVEQISNKKWLPLPWLRIESLLHGGMKFQAQYNLDISNGEYVQNHKSFFSLLPYTKITRRHQVTCLQRGVYRLNSVSLSCGDVLGLSHTTKRIELDAELFVYPKPLPPEELRLPDQSWQGDVTVRRWIVDDPFMIAGVREYRYGDSLKGVNWKATARTGKLQVHQHDYTADFRLMIVLNIEDHEGMWNTVKELDRVERAISYAAGLADYALSQGLEAGFATNAQLLDGPKSLVRMAPRSGQDYVGELYEMFARLHIAPSVTFHELLGQEAMMQEGRYDYVILTAFVSEAIEEQLEGLKQRGHRVEVVMLPDRSPDREKQEGAAHGG
ncbi:DUF58 domain-containing protein [Paenibacillaceae bacterium]|nr:DUF58 domain-containing protein [Paenibacillaceae bacterium]